jgi:hypothetical protein
MLIKQGEGGQCPVSIFVVQPGHQNVPIGQYVDFAGHGLEAVLKLPDDAALIAERQIRRAVLEQASQAEATAAWRSDFGCD